MGFTGIDFLKQRQWKADEEEKRLRWIWVKLAEELSLGRD